MRVQIDLGIRQRPGQLFNAVGGTLLGQVICKEFRVIIRKNDRYASSLAANLVVTIHGNNNCLQPSASLLCIQELCLPAPCALVEPSPHRKFALRSNFDLSPHPPSPEGGCGDKSGAR
jgi:hypothetical protein